jgi:hypothetical protein
MQNSYRKRDESKVNQSSLTTQSVITLQRKPLIELLSQWIFAATGIIYVTVLWLYEKQLNYQDKSA